MAVNLPDFPNLDRFADAQPQSNPAYGRQRKAMTIPTSDGADVPQRDGDDFKGDGSFQMKRDAVGIEYISLETRTVDCPSTGAFLKTNLHPDGWIAAQKGRPQP